MGTLCHLVLVLPFGRLTTLFLCSVKGVEVGAFVVVETLGMLMNDVCGDFVEESSIVGYDEEGRGIGLEISG